MASLPIAVLFVTLIVAINGQGMFPGMSMMSRMAPMSTSFNSSPQIWPQFLFYRMMFGDAAARLIMADRLSNMMGGSPFSRYYAGEYLDTPDAWWLTSSLLNRNSMMQNGGTGMPTNTLPATSGTSGTGAGSI